MIPTDVSGSRFPVGSSQTSSGGWLTNARAIETRCCSPPESSSGSEFILCERPTIESTSGTFLRIDVAALALHLERVGDVLGRGAVREQLEVLEDAADVAAQHRHLRPLEPRRSRPPTTILPLGRLELLQQQADERRLARAGGADDEDELALVDVERDVAQRDDVGLVDLRHRLEHDHRRRRSASRSARRRRLGDRGCGRVRVGFCTWSVTRLSPARGDRGAPYRGAPGAEGVGEV